MTKNICFINNYNNEKFIRECLESVYAQTLPFDEVLIVDDGSTDSSIQIIEEFSSRYVNLKLLEKRNEGQISTFNFVLPLIPENSQIFLLDGDDIYPRDYLELVIKLLGNEGWDFSFCEQQKFYGNESTRILTASISDVPCKFFSSTSALTRSRGCWIGSPTSCIALSSKLFKEIFPYPYFGDKIFWVDDLLIFSSSILGAHKIHIPSLGVGWRSHAHNVTKKNHTSQDIMTRKISLAKIFDWYCASYKIPIYPDIFEFFTEYKNLGPYWQRRLDLPSKWRMLNRLLRTSIKQAFMKKT